jgi:hypothetical protein
LQARDLERATYLWVDDGCGANHSPRRHLRRRTTYQISRTAMRMTELGNRSSSAVVHSDIVVTRPKRTNFGRIFRAGCVWRRAQHFAWRRNVTRSCSNSRGHDESELNGPSRPTLRPGLVRPPATTIHPEARHQPNIF